MLLYTGCRNSFASPLSDDREGDAKFDAEPNLGSSCDMWSVRRS